VLSFSVVAVADERDTVTGEVVQAWTEHDDADEAAAHADDALLTWIETDDGTAVRVPTDDLADELSHVSVGSTVSVSLGAAVADGPSADQGLAPAREVLDAEVIAPAVTTPTPTAPAGEVTDAVTVVMMAPLGVAADGRTLSDVVAAVDGPVASFWSEQTAGAVQLQVDAQYDWFQGTVDCSDPYALWAEAAAHAGNWTPGPRKHLLVYLPNNAPGCSYGLAEVSNGLAAGGRAYVTDVTTAVIAHELGHNFGLGHSSGRQCSSAVDSGSCRTVPYRDYYDVMGASWEDVGTLTVGQAARLGVLPTAAQQTLTAPFPATTVTLSPVSGSSGVRGVRVVGASGTYWLEYRPASGRDAFLTGNRLGLLPGVLLRQQTSASGDTSLLLDGSPSPSSGWDGDLAEPLAVGSAVRIDRAGVGITVLSQTPTAATVRITQGSNTLPWGNWEALSQRDLQLSVGGWAFDPDSPSTPSVVHVYVDGRGTAVTADGARPDVGRFFPFAGGDHGFSWSTSVAPGTHTVCVFAIDPDYTWLHTVLGCRQITVGLARPLAGLESVGQRDLQLSVGGWAFDPDSPSTPSAVHVYVDGRGTAVTADGARPDVGRVFPFAGGTPGFSWSTSVAPGTHTVCLFAIDNEFPWLNTGLGCRQITVGLARPWANWESATIRGGQLSVGGWAFDPDFPSSSTPVHVYVDGVGTVLTADGARPDVGRVFPFAGSGHGFSWSVPVSPGRHSVCVYAIDAPFFFWNTPLGCRTVTS
jgi:hypothetical protein